MSTIETIKAISALMTEKGWDKNGSAGAVKRDEAGKIVAKHGSPEFFADFDDARETLEARAALAEINARLDARGASGGTDFGRTVPWPKLPQGDTITRRFPAPWRVVELTAAFRIEDANGFPVAYTYFESDEERRASKIDCMTRDEARRISVNMARLPGLLGAETTKPGAP